MTPAQYYCDRLLCSWHGEDPAWSDASVEIMDAETGVLRHTHAHVPLCPVCFNDAVLMKEGEPA